MISVNTVAVIAAAALLLSVSPAALAQQKIEESGVDSMTGDHRIIELEKGHLLILAHEKGVETTTDPSMPTNMSAIDCYGMVDILPDQTSKGNGYCVLVDRDGDKVFQSWQSSSDMPETKYQTIGGTGKFEGAKGAGTAKSTEIVAGEQGRSVIHWKGATEYPKLKK